MTETAISAAFKRAGVDARPLHAMAVEMMRASGLNIVACHTAIDHAYADMKPKELPGHNRHEIQVRDARQGEEGHPHSEPHTRQASSPPRLRDGKEGQLPNEPHDQAAPPVVQSKEPTTATIKGRASAAKVIAVTIMDTYRLSNGQVFGDLYWGSLNRIRNASIRDAMLCRLALNHGVVSDPANTKVRDVLNVEDMQRMIQKSAELADAM